MPPLLHHHQYTQVIFGFIRRVMGFCEMYKPNNIAFTWDSTRSIRSEIYPEYKLNRRTAIKEMSDIDRHSRRVAKLQFSDIRDKVLWDLGFVNNFTQTGYEADDIMASIANNNPDHHLFVLTTDRDMLQILSDTCHIINPMNNKIMTPEIFTYEYKCEPSLWGEAKAIAGCGTDNVSGVSGVAEKTAIKFLLGKLNEDSTKYQDIKDNAEITALNRELVILPMSGTKDIVLSDMNDLSTGRFISVCKEYDFRSLLSAKYKRKWEALLR